MTQDEAKAIREAIEGLTACGLIIDRQLQAAMKALQAAGVFASQIETIVDRGKE